MARRSLAICVILGCLALLIGCAGTAGPREASPALVAPVEPNAVALAEPAAAVPEPNDVEANPGPGPQDANDAPEPNDVDVAAVYRR